MKYADSRLQRLIGTNDYVAWCVNLYVMYLRCA